jgi:SAM-dependent methyltransferase
MKKVISLVCVCCEKDQAVSFRKSNGFQMYKCVNCDFVSVHPLPDFAKIEAHYNDTRTNTNQKEIRANLFPIFVHEPNNPKRDFFDSVFKKVQNLLKKDKFDILEIGSGFGYFIHYANEIGHHAIGTEVTKQYAELGSESLNGRIVYVENDQYSDHFSEKSFDLIYMEHVFEHVLNPDKILQAVRKLLRPGGVFFIAVPNMKSVSSAVQGKLWAWAAAPDHLYFYNPTNLQLLLKRYGFQIHEVSAKDYHHRSIPQLYSFRRIFNIFRKLVGMKPKPFKYKYPESIGDYLVLLPYFILYPFVRLIASKKRGNELIIFAVCPS